MLQLYAVLSVVHAMSAGTCSYLLGNKGCHTYNGNPKGYEDEVTLDEKTRKILEGRFHESVGHITLSRGKESPPIRGTGFRVGGKYVMSDYHVFRDHILDILEQLIFHMPLPAKDNEKNTIKELQKILEVETLGPSKGFDKVVASLFCEFLQKHGTNVNLLLQKLEELYPKHTIVALADITTENWKNNCIVEFSGRGKFYVDWDIKFGDEKNDVIILELKNETPHDVPFPPPLLVDYKHRPDEDIQIVQYRIKESDDQDDYTETKIEKEIIVSTKCELFCKDFLDVRKNCIEWWKRWWINKEDRFEHEDIDFQEHFEKECSTQYDKESGVLITQASWSFTEGSSGSPMMYLYKSIGQPVVTSIFQGGLPLFYYKKPKDGYKSLRNDDNDKVCGKYLFEKGRSMEKIAELLANYRKDDLKENIFGPLKRVEERLSNYGGRREPSDHMLRTVEAWEKEDKTCFATKGVKDTRDRILSNNCVCVTGDPGSGKSMSIRHAALRLMKEHDFIVYPISSPEDFFKYLDENKSQVFVIDDILGIHSVYKDLMNQWSKHHDVIKCLLSEQTKILASLRTHLVQHQNVRLEDFIFLEKSKRVDLYHDDYKLNSEERMNMLRWQLNAYNINENEVEAIITKISGEQTYVEMDPHVSDSFPLLCKMFCTDPKLRVDPNAFFNDPFPALIKTFRKMKCENRPLFCGLVLCVAFDGKLSGETLSTFAQFTGELDDKIVLLRDHLVRSLRLDPRSDLDSVKSALTAVDGSYVIRMGNDYEISHRMFHDLVTFVYDDKLFIFKFGTSQFIRDRIRVKKRKDDDQFVVVCGGEKNIERLATRLTDDFKSDLKTLTDNFQSHLDIETEAKRMTTGEYKYGIKRNPFMGASFIVENPNIDDDSLIGRLRETKLENLDERAITTLFKECFMTIQENSRQKLDLNSDGDVKILQFKLIQLLLELGADCNIKIDMTWPLHISVSAGSLQLTRLLLDKGADKRICDRMQCSVLHLACLTKHNNLPLIEMFLKEDIDKVPAVRVLSLRKWLELNSEEHIESLPAGNGKMLKVQTKDKFFVQLEEVGPKGYRKVLTDNLNHIDSSMQEYSGGNKLQLVEILHHSCLNSAAFEGQNVLHLAIRYSEAAVVEKLLKLGPKLTCKNDPDERGRTPQRLLEGDEQLQDRYQKIQLF